MLYLAREFIIFLLNFRESFALAINIILVLLVELCSGFSPSTFCSRCSCSCSCNLGHQIWLNFQGVILCLCFLSCAHWWPLCGLCLLVPSQSFSQPG
ncbi:unnamed protein product [Moneuplotes crassus]|uniref:Uncharacterized protein n=1 Tax=Euplotes crassus TaxID=5936 RepID=A0AAD1XLH7_EUPCR|nr:unnamed protein product [Moneuplotes crassus]